MRRRQRSAAEWAVLIAEFRGGTETETEFCRRHDLGFRTFRRHKYALSSASRRQREAGFRELAVVAPVATPFITVHGPGGIRVEVPMTTDVDAVAALAKALGDGR